MNTSQALMRLAVLFYLAMISEGWSQEAEKVTLDSVEFQKLDLATALNFLAAKGGEPPVNVVLIDPEAKHAATAISLKLSSVPWPVAMKYTCDLAGLEWRWDRGVALVGTKAAVGELPLMRSKILISPGGEAMDALLRKSTIVGIEFRNDSLGDVAAVFRDMGRRILAEHPNTPLNVLIKENAANPVATRAVSVKLHGATMAEILHLTTGLAGCRFRIDPAAIVIGEAADVARQPKVPAKLAGPIATQLAGKRFESIEVPVGTKASEFVELMRTLAGVNTIALAPDAVSASGISFQKVTALDLLRYYNEVSGTAFRLDPSAVVIYPDPDVKTPPKVPVAPSGATGPEAAKKPLKFDP